MQIVEAQSRLTFESRSISARTWSVWAILFLPGLLALLLLPEANRFIGLIVWMVIWLGSILLLPRWVGDKVQVIVDKANRQMVWERNGAVTQQIKFGEVKGFAVKKISTATRPYTAFQLVALLRNNSQITLAIDPKESQIQQGLKLARKYGP